jgi:hypothetical protein
LRDTESNLGMGIFVGIVGAMAAFAGGLEADKQPHTSPVHHGLVGCIMVVGGLALRNDFFTPAIALTGAGMALSDIQDLPQWLEIGHPMGEDVTPSTTLTY